jgi:uncharacterized protein (TIGR02453 family)
MHFTGFPPEALTFYANLERDNTKAFWDAHRDVYEDAVREPMELLVLDLQREFGAAKVYRPYRDVRFSKDKTPYKTHQGAIFDSHRYVQISAEGLRVGGGRYRPEPPALAKIRRAIDHGVHGRELEAIKAELEAADMTYMPPALKTAPRGYPKDHPRIDLLRCKTHAAFTSFEIAPWLHTAEAKDRIAEAWRRLGPLVAWLERHGA